MHAPPSGEKRMYLSLPYTRVFVTALIGHNVKSFANISPSDWQDFFAIMSKECNFDNKVVNLVSRPPPLHRKLKYGCYLFNSTHWRLAK
jgi:hypothetical protein